MAKGNERPASRFKWLATTAGLVAASLVILSSGSPGAVIVVGLAIAWSVHRYTRKLPPLEHADGEIDPGHELAEAIARRAGRKAAADVHAETTESEPPDEPDEQPHSIGTRRLRGTEAVEARRRNRRKRDA